MEKEMPQGRKFRERNDPAAGGRPVSSRRQVLCVFAILLVPVLSFVLAYGVYTMGALKDSMADNAKNTLYLYQKEWRMGLENVENNLLDVVANNADYQRLYYPLGGVEAHLASYAILEHYKNLMNTFEFLGGMYISSSRNNLCRGVYQSSYGYETKQELDRLAAELLLERTGEADNQGEGAAGSAGLHGWQICGTGSAYFLGRVIGFRDTYCVALVALDDIVKPQDGTERGGRNGTGEGKRAGTGHILLCSEEGTPYGDLEFLDNQGISLKTGGEGVTITGGKTRYLVVSEPFEAAEHLYMAYLTPFHGIFSEMNLIQLIMLALCGIILLVIPFCYHFLKRNFFYPLANLTDTMNEIRNGRVDAQMDTGYRNREFCQVSLTFNNMIKQIGDLKIAAYESELNLQQARLQYLQLQLRPHFFLNCLKNLYGLAQEGRYQQIQNMILELSDYLRYTFRDGTAFVTMEEERRHVEHYIALQQMSGARRIRSHIQIRPELSELLIPPLTLLTFVENAVKHADTGQEPLEIQIKALLLQDEEQQYLNLTVRDNGKGFPLELLERQNGGSRPEETGEKQVGIRNICRRIYLLYRGKGSVSFSNQAQGACAEIFIPVQEQGTGGEQNDNSYCG